MVYKTIKTVRVDITEDKDKMMGPSNKPVVEFNLLVLFGSMYTTSF